MQINTEGLIVKEQNVGDSDKLVTVLTDKLGTIRAFARGVKNAKSRNAVSTQLFCYSNFIIYKGRDKYIINESDPKELFYKLRQDIVKLSLAQYFCELITLIVPESIDSKEFLRLALNSLYYLSEDKCGKDIIKSAFEMRLMVMSGYMPDLVCCRECSEYESDNMYFIPQDGNLYCDKCYAHGNVSGGVLLNRGAYTALRHTVYSEFNKLFSFNLSGNSMRMLNMASEQYILRNTDRNLKTLEFYNTVSREM